MSYQDIIRSPYKELVLLAEPQFPYEVSRHRFPNGVPNNSSELWKRNFVIGATTYNQAEYVVIDPFIRGLPYVPREVMRVTVNGIEYAQANSVHSCDATYGSWHYDASTRRLYVTPGFSNAFDKFFTLAGTVYEDETDDARTSTLADVTMLGSNGNKHYIGMYRSRHRFWRFKFSTAPAGGTHDWKYWDGDAVAFSSAINANLVAVVGNVNLTATDNIIRWTTPQADWDLTDTVGDDTAANPRNEVGFPECFWIEISNSSGYSTAGVGSQFFVAPVLEESLVVAYLEVPLGNKSIFIDDKHYLGRLITGDQNTELEITGKNPDAFQEAMIGTAVTGSGGDLSISNGDGAFDDFYGGKQVGSTIYAAEFGSVPFGGKVPMLVGYNANPYVMPYDDYITLRTPLIEGVHWTPNILKLLLMNQSMRLDVPMLPKKLSVLEYPNMEEDKEGEDVPIFFGDTEVFAPVDGDKDTPKTKTARSLRGKVVHPGKVRGNGAKNCRVLFGTQILNPETGTYHGYGTVHEIRAIKNNNKKSAKIKATKYDLSESNTRVDFKKKYVLKGEAIMRTEGIIDDALGTFTGTALAKIVKPWDIAHFVMVCVSKIKTSELKLASLTEVGVTKQGVAGTLNISPSISDTCSAYIYDGKQKVRDFVNKLMFQIDSVCQPNNDGLMQIAPRSESIPNSAPVLLKHHKSDYEIVHDTQYMGNIAIRFRQIPATDEYSSTDSRTVENQPNSFGFPVYIQDNYLQSYLGINNMEEFETYMVTATQAQALRDRLQKRFRRGLPLFRVREIYGLTIDTLLGEKIIHNDSRALGGEADDYQTWLISAQRDQGKHSVFFEALEAKFG